MGFGGVGCVCLNLRKVPQHKGKQSSLLLFLYRENQLEPFGGGNKEF